MKKLILLLSILTIGCQTNTQNPENNMWTFDATDGSYIQWNGDDKNANEMLHLSLIHI